MIKTAKILRYDGTHLLVKPTEPLNREILQKQSNMIEIRLTDGREISAEQRKKTYALLRDISEWSGYAPDETKQIMKYTYIIDTGEADFSLSTTDMTTAREFITYLIGFCFKNNVPTKNALLSQSDDIGRYLYMCLEHRKCAVCNKPAQVHHVDRIGMGRNRDTVSHIGLRAIALCYEHHDEAHRNEIDLFKRYCIYGIKLDKYLCQCLNLNTMRG